MTVINITLTDTRFDGMDINNAEKAELIKTMIKEDVLDLSDEFVSDLNIEVGGV